MYKLKSMFSRRKKVHEGLEVYMGLTLNSYYTTLHLSTSHITVVAISIKVSVESFLGQGTWKKKSSVKKFLDE